MSKWRKNSELILSQDWSRMFMDRNYREKSEAIKVLKEEKSWDLAHIMTIWRSRSKKELLSKLNINTENFDRSLESIFDTICELTQWAIENRKCPTRNAMWKDVNRWITFSFATESDIGMSLILNSMIKKQRYSLVSYHLSKYKYYSYSKKQIESYIWRSWNISRNSKWIATLVEILEERIEAGSFNYLDLLYLESLVNIKNINILTELFEYGILKFPHKEADIEFFQNLYESMKKDQKRIVKISSKIKNIIKKNGMNYTVRSIEKNRLKIFVYKAN